MLDPSRPDPLRSSLLGGCAKVSHGFFTRRGGVSEGIYASLNIGTGSSDDPVRVAENRGRVAAWLGVAPTHLISVWQVHSPDVVTVTEPFTGERPKADALVTNRPGLAIGASTADCGPVLFADAEAGVVGAAHAGWKGAIAGVLENTVEAMEALGARRENIAAALGPTISQPNYEVGPEFKAHFSEADAENERFFAPAAKPGHSLFDLPGYILSRLARAGVRAEALGRCTYAGESDFFSFRRATHRGEPDYGRLIAAIALEER